MYRSGAHSRFFTIAPAIFLFYYLFQNSVLAFVPNDQHYAKQWALTKINAPATWDIIQTSPVKIAIIDDGIDALHPDLSQANIIKGYDYGDGDAEVQVTDNIDSLGTIVAGTIGANLNNYIGIAGIISNATLYILRVFDRYGSTTTDKIIAAINDAINANAKIIIISFTARNFCTTTPNLQAAIDNAYNHGVVVVVPAGNDAGNASFSNPASCQHVIAVGATKNDDTRAYYSNSGPEVDIAAPGGYGYGMVTEGEIFSLASNNRYYYESGTHISAAYVAAAAALILSQSPDLSLDEVLNRLVSTADPIVTDKPIGPRLNLLNALPNQSLPTPTISLSPTTTTIQNPYDFDNDHDVDCADLLTFLGREPLTILNYNRILTNISNL